MGGFSKQGSRQEFSGDAAAIEVQKPFSIITSLMKSLRERPLSNAFLSNDPDWREGREIDIATVLVELSCLLMNPAHSFRDRITSLMAEENPSSTRRAMVLPLVKTESRSSLIWGRLSSRMVEFFIAEDGREEVEPPAIVEVTRRRSFLVSICNSPTGSEQGQRRPSKVAVWPYNGKGQGGLHFYSHVLSAEKVRDILVPMETGPDVPTALAAEQPPNTCNSMQKTPLGSCRYTGRSNYRT